MISAVGHETDVTIADYVADLRAPTPSAAAELAIFDYQQFEEQVRFGRERLERAMARTLEQKKFQTRDLEYRLKLRHPERQLNEKRQFLADAQDRLETLMETRLERSRHRLALLAGRLSGLSPLEKLKSGYGFVTDGDGRRLKSVFQVKKGDPFHVYLADGKLTGTVTELTPGGAGAEEG